MIRKFWDSLAEPMLRMINETFREGELMNTFKLGLIKLIPKKGDARKVSDWRPITLLCCGYKLISGVVANRLEKYLYKIIGRAQKGFMREKNINTCTINIMNNVSRAWKDNKATGVLCVDFSKAFDSVEHGMIVSVMEFFGFGGAMCRMVKTLLTDRKSRIILDEGLSEMVIIERGTPQGDRSSPYIFIMCIEILLMRLLKETGRGIEDPGLIMDLCDNFGDRIDVRDTLCEAYADDLTITFSMGEESLRTILEIMDEFGQVSGLVINIGKTQLMVVGSNEWETGNRFLRIEIVNKVKILGIVIDRKLENLDENWEEALSKMERISRYWATFSLSISGRVMVAKTYIMSQMVYLMGMLPLGIAIGNRINEVLLHFIKGSDRMIERRRQLLGSELGGYGLIDVNILNTCMKAAWIGRWKNETNRIDWLAMIVWNGANETLTRNVDTRRVHNIGLPILEDILCKWLEFKKYFYEVGNNIREAEVFGNEAITGGRGRMEDIVFTRERGDEILVELRNLEKRIEDITTETGDIRSKIEVDRELGLQLTGWNTLG